MRESLSTAISRRAWAMALVAVLALVATVYAPTVDDYFGGDDFMVLGPVRAMGAWELIWKSFIFRDNIPYWRPLVSPLYAAEVHLFQLRPWPYHAVVIALHLINVALLALVVRALTGRRWLALAAALIYGIHPAKTTTVPMISSTVELVGMVWYLTAVLCCIRLVRGGGRRWYWAGLAAFILGLLSKESVASAAGVITVLFFLLGLVPAWHTGRKRALGVFILRILPFWLLTIPYTILTFVNDTEDPTGFARVMYAVGPHIGQNLWWLVARLAAPVDAGQGPTVSVAGHVGAALLVSATVLLLLRGRNETRFLIAWTAIALTPLALWRPELLVGRFTYMASAPFAVLLALAASWFAAGLRRVLPSFVPRVAPGAALTAVLVALFAPLTMQQSLQRTREGETYQLLVATLEEHPTLPLNSEVLLVDGVWQGPFHAVFLNAVADTLYGPGTVRILNANAEDVPARGVARNQEVVRLRYRDGALAVEGRAR